MDLENKTALITGSGACGGIGAETARLFAKHGAHVVITGRDAARGEEVAQDIAAAGGEARFVLADLTDLDAVGRLADNVGSVDALVNNAASFVVAATVDQDTMSFDDLFAANVRGPYFLTAALLPAMITRGSGSIVNVSTMAARIGVPGMSVYGATKAAFDSFTRTLAVELTGTGVRVNTVAPGPTRSDKIVTIMGDLAEQLGQTTPLQRLASISEIAEVVFFLASDRASYITGATLAADGGRTAA
jgi:NAD(P)-dependent dehydrogenase (short-subunit alcohol dehydrogenase family)